MRRNRHELLRQKVIWFHLARKLRGFLERPAFFTEYSLFCQARLPHLLSRRNKKQSFPIKIVGKVNKPFIRAPKGEMSLSQLNLTQTSICVQMEKWLASNEMHKSLGSVTGQLIWDFTVEKWHSSRFFSEHFCFSCHLLFYQALHYSHLPFEGGTLGDSRPKY
jgi:hypothetical protein